MPQVIALPFSGFRGEPALELRTPHGYLLAASLNFINSAGSIFKVSAILQMFTRAIFRSPRSTSPI